MTENHEQKGVSQSSSVIDTSWQYARCPECQAVFRVDQTKLVVRQGEVRCGACRVVFHAPSHKVFRNHGGGFSALISEPEVESVVAPEPVAQGSSIDLEPGVPQGDPFGSTLAETAEVSLEAKNLFAEEEIAKDPVDRIQSRSRLFEESPEVAQTTEASEATEWGELHHSVGEPISDNASEIVIPKISSEPLVSRSEDSGEGCRKEPAMAVASFSAPSREEDSDGEEQSDSFQIDSDTVRAAREALIFQPLSEIEAAKEPLSIEMASVPTSFTPKETENRGWSDASVQPYGASAMPTPPRFEPVVADTLTTAEPRTEPDVSAEKWSEKEDSLLDHNPFSPRNAESAVASEPAEIKVEPRPAAINMSGVDEYIVDRPNPLAGFFWFLVSAAFVVLLGLQVKYFLVERFAQDESYRPYLQVFCGIARCELPPRRDAYRFTITQTRVDLHPQEPGALRITVRLLNQAKFAQPYPDLRLTLTDRVGRVVGRRKFDPGFYLPKGAATRLASGELGYVVFDLAQPHEKAVGFVVDVVRRSS